MKKSFIIILTISLLSTSLFNTSISLGNTIEKSSTGNTFYVGGTGSGNYTKIQDAIDNASNGDTVFVYNGIYYEHIVIDKSITLHGEDKHNTIIDGNGVYGGIILISSNFVNVNGLTLQNTTFAGLAVLPFSCNNTIFNIISKDSFVGIQIYYDSDNNTFYDNILSKNSYVGIDIAECTNVNLTNNIIVENQFGGIACYGLYNSIFSKNNISNTWSIDGEPCGISLSNSYNNILVDNSISNNTNGISIYESFNNSIIDNVFLDDGITLDSRLFYDFTDYENIVTVVGNTVNGKPMLYLLNESDVNVGNAGQVIIVNSENITVENQDLVGVHLIESHFCEITKNKISPNKRTGILLDGYYDSCKNNTVSYNIIKNWNQTGIGIDLMVTKNTLIFNNSICCNFGGINLDGSTDRAVNAKIYNNIISNNLGGIVSHHGKCCIYHNDFINNSIENAFDYGENYWNSSFGEGNYWDSYTGVDENEDGIGDTPYNVSGYGNRKDYYPLMKPYNNFEPPEDQDTELNVTIKTGFGILFREISASVENRGDVNADNVNLSLSVEYGFLRHNKNSSGEFTILEPGEVSDSITVEDLRGLGKIKITAEATADNADSVQTAASGWMIGRFIILTDFKS